MKRTKLKSRVVVGAGVLLVITCAILTARLSVAVFGRRSLKLSAGNLVPAISLGERHGLIVASDGSLWSWGSDFLGWPVLGLGDRAKPSPRLRRIGHENNWVSISAGVGHSLAIKSDGTLWTWGESVQEQFARPKPAGTPVPAAPGNDWKQAAAGGIHSVALKKDGTLWAWGNNWAGSVGSTSPEGSSVPVQIGSETNWIRIWAGSLETVGMQSDHSLWYWGDSPDPACDMKAGRIPFPMLISPDTDWVDVGFGVNTVFAIKANGTLWTWGRQAHVYTGASDTAKDATPTRIGTDSDWQSISAAAGWWCQGLIKKDGSLWLMDASDGKPNGPQPPYKPVRFRRIEFPKPYVAYAGGAVHAAAPGMHGPIGVILTSTGEVWTWGLVLGDPSPLTSILAFLAHPSDVPLFVFREKPWRLGCIEPTALARQS